MRKYLFFGIIILLGLFSLPNWVQAQTCSAQMYLRGTNNGWATTAMTLIDAGSCTWETTATFGSANNARFKFDLHGDWSQNYGDNNNDGFVDYFGGDIYITQGAGDYTISYMESTGAYSVNLDTPPTPTPSPAPNCSAQMYQRGTNNGWATTAMTLIDSGSCTWETTATFGSAGNERFKFDVHGDWSQNYGDNNNDGFVDASGNDIAISDGAGAYEIRYIENTGAYAVAKQTTPPTVTPTTVPPTATPTKAPPTVTPTVVPPTATPESGTGITVHYKGYTIPKIYAWVNENGSDVVLRGEWSGSPMTAESNGWYVDSFPTRDFINIIFNDGNGNQTPDLSRTTGEWWYKDGTWTDFNPEDSVPPTVSITSPSHGAFLSAVSSVTVNASDNVGIEQVEFFFAGQSVGTSSVAPYTLSWNTAQTCSGSGALTAVATDLAGNSTTSTAVNVTLNNPNQPPVANAGTDRSAVVGISFQFNGSGSTDECGIVSYSWSNGLTGATPSTLYNTAGTYTVNLTVTDANGATDTDDVVITVREQAEREDFRGETIYFLMTTRFYDGDSSNNVYAWDGESAGNVANNDPAWRGDFKGLVEKLDYIKALGFTAIWVTPVVENISGYDYHGYHAVDFSEVDPRYESPEYDYQRLIDEVHARDMKIIQDVVFNHTGNFGEENIYPLFAKDYSTPDTAENLVSIAPAGLLPENYNSLPPAQQFQARLTAMKEDFTDTEHIYHHEKSLSWEGYTVQTGQIAGDAVDLNTENPTTYNYIINAYNQYIDMGVDGFRVDTVKHISRLTFNEVFNPAFKARGGENFYMFGEVATRYRQVWNNGIPAISTPFYTWGETQDYGWSDTDRTVNEALVFQHWQDNQNIGDQPTSNNHYLNGNNYHAPDTSTASGMGVIDFPMHWNFANARDAFGVALGGDHYYQDATWNVVYVDSHDYAPDTAPENQRFALGQDVWAENLSLMFTFRGIPTLYYGSEIEFQKGAVIDVGPNSPLAETGRAYFGDHIEGSVTVTGFGEYSNATGELANSLNHPLAQHIRRLNQIRHAVPALQFGQYSVDDVSGSAMAFRRRYTDETTDSFALVAISGSATFTNLPEGVYRDAITGHSVFVPNGGSLSMDASGKGNMRVYVLDGSGKIGEDGVYLHP